MLGNERCHPPSEVVPVVCLQCCLSALEMNAATTCVAAQVMKDCQEVCYMGCVAWGTLHGARDKRLVRCSA
eukprot:1147844-Pelagomonas_calceolata.AAC.6